MIIFIILLAVIIIYNLQIYIYKKYWNKGLSALVSFEKDAVTEGDENTLCETVTNNKAWPLVALTVKFSVNRGLVFADSSNISVSDTINKTDIFTVSGYKIINRKMKFSCEKRGYYKINNISLVGTDILLTKSFVCNIPANKSIFVYPKCAEGFDFSVPLSKLSGTATAKRFNIEDPFEFKGIREYQPYDSIRSVNWKASAKSGELKVNTKQITSSPEITILLNLETETNRREFTLIEESIRIAVSICEALNKNGISYALITNASDIRDKSIIEQNSGCGSLHLTSIKEKLASVNENGSFPLFADIVEEKLCGTDGIYIMISHSNASELSKKFDKLCEENNSYWIFPHRYGKKPDIADGKNYTLVTREVL